MRSHSGYGEGLRGRKAGEEWGEGAKDHLTREMQLAQAQNAKGEQEVWPRLDLD